MQVSFEKKEILAMIDSTLLSPVAEQKDIEKLCHDAVKYGFSAVIVNPVYVKLAVSVLKKMKSAVKVGTVVGFPLGSDLTKVKIYEARRAIREGAHDIDIVMPIYAIKQGKWDVFETELKKLQKVCRGRTVKIILETCYLSDAEIIKACEICVSHKVRFVKTSTGYGKAKKEGTTGATKRVIELMFKAIANAPRTFDKDLFTTEIKASGGINDFMQAKMLADAGARRIGTSCAALIAEFDSEELDNKIAAERAVKDAEDAELIARLQREAAEREAVEAEEAVAEADAAQETAEILSEVLTESSEPVIIEESEVFMPHIDPPLIEEESAEAEVPEKKDESTDGE